MPDRLPRWLIWLGGAALLLVLVDRLVQSQHLPWRPLEAQHPPGLFTTLKLQLLDQAPQRCERLLAELSVAAARAPDRVFVAGCAWQHVYRVAAFNGVALKPGPTPLTCRMAVATALWLRWRVEPIAQAQLGASVTALTHMGSYSCRPIRGSRTGMMSEHASANALDVSGFTLANGTQIALPRDRVGDGPKAQALRALNASACDIYAVTLGPTYNAAHADHFHVDLGAYQTCR
jgi:hypothetical protein